MKKGIIIALVVFLLVAAAMTSISMKGVIHIGWAKPGEMVESAALIVVLIILFWLGHKCGPYRNEETENEE